MPLERAARVTSPVEHTGIFGQTLATPGAIVIGGVFIGAAVVGGAPAAVVFGAFMSGMAAGGLSISAGQAWDKYVAAPDASEKIEKGVEHVLLDEPKHQAANVSEVTLTDQHMKSPQTGSDSVYIENKPASRRKDITTCGGEICDGSEHIFYGGGVAGDPKKPDEQLPFWMQITQDTFKLGGLIVTPKSAFDKIDLVLNVVDYFNGFKMMGMDGGAKDAAFLGKDAYGVFK